jgi:hypothetical protein
MLLPLPAATVRDLSLEYHLSLTSVRHGAGNAVLLVNLAKVMYLTYFLQDAGYVQTFDRFHETEKAMERANRRGCETDQWYLDDGDYALFEAILTLHDQQLILAPAHAVLSANTRLNRFIAGDAPSPLPRR